MRETAKTLKSFVGGFELPAYATHSVPKDVQLPYLTYPLVEPEWNQKATFYIQGWYAARKLSEMMEKCDQILREIGEGITISTDHGYVVLRPETPQVQFFDDQEHGTKSFYINLSINSYHTPGV